ncbi:hypothetical protein OPQ81_005032 [Rhizoctonia solani]|nr:hypothetical protein OPQ81_005032 [Rhizoctonia solani]
MGYFRLLKKLSTSLKRKSASTQYSDETGSPTIPVTIKEEPESFSQSRPRSGRAAREQHEQKQKSAADSLRKHPMAGQRSDELYRIQMAKRSINDRSPQDVSVATKQLKEKGADKIPSVGIRRVSTK